MAQIILNVEDNTLLPAIKAAVEMLRGVISVKVQQDIANKETIEAIRELNNGEYAGKLDTSTPDALMKSLMAL